MVKNFSMIPKFNEVGIKQTNSMPGCFFVSWLKYHLVTFEDRLPLNLSFHFNYLQKVTLLPVCDTNALNTFNAPWKQA